MFTGEFEPKLDQKGRLILPARFREELAGGMFVTRGHDRCLFVFPRPEFLELYRQIKQAPLTSKEARSYQRVLLSGASEEYPDKQGRITVPASLRRYANLQRDLAVLGVGDHLEIWPLEAWNDYLDQQEDPYAELDNPVFPGVEPTG